MQHCSELEKNQKSSGSRATNYSFLSYWLFHSCRSRICLINSLAANAKQWYLMELEGSIVWLWTVTKLEYSEPLRIPNMKSERFFISFQFLITNTLCLHRNTIYKSCTNTDVEATILQHDILLHYFTLSLSCSDAVCDNVREEIHRMYDGSSIETSYSTLRWKIHCHKKAVFESIFALRVFLDWWNHVISSLLEKEYGKENVLHARIYAQISRVSPESLAYRLL